MGAVYEAEQDKPKRIVALKVIKSAWANPELLRRFEQEAQALARLQHSGIAQIYEAGTAETGAGPQPYFAMELIAGGLRLTQYAETRRLNVRERLELIAQICDAVHHAHQRGIIHRDLKPGNILVDESGHPKILDFGVARMTDSDAQATRQTDVGQLVGTLAYMSPEQALADPLEIDIRSDVYALGVILYELLAKKLPYALSKKLHEAVLTIREQDPASLSMVSRAYRGDIETIAAKALEKDKTRRYPSAADLAADIRRYLKDEPIVARPASTLYQLRKFAQRHKALVSGVAAVFLVLVAGIAASTYQAVRASRAERAATEQRDRALTAEQSANQERNRALASEAQANQERNRAVASEAQANRERNNAVAQKQRADNEAAIAKAVNDFLRDDVLAQASAQRQAGPGQKPDQHLEVRTALDRAAAGIEGKFAAQPLVEASIRQTIGVTYKDLGVYPEAQKHLEAALALRRQALGEKSSETLQTMATLAEVYRYEGMYGPAEELYTKALDGRRRLLGEEHRDTLSSLNGLGSLYATERKFPQAEAIFAKLLEIERRVQGEENQSTVTTINNLAYVYRFQGKLAEAEPLNVKVVDLYARLLGKQHPYTLVGMHNLALIYEDRGKYTQAEELLSEVLEAERTTLGEEHPNRLVMMTSLGNLYRLQDKYGQAEQVLTRALEGQRRILGPEHPDTLGTLESLSYVWVDAAKYAEAEPGLKGALKRYQDSGREADVYATQIWLARSLAGQKKFEEAEPLLVPGYEGLLRLRANNPTAHAATLKGANERIPQFYKDWGKPEKAAEWQRAHLQ